MITDLLVRFYEQLKIVNICPENNLLPEKKQICLSRYQTLHWYFNNLASSHHYWSKPITTTIPISNDNRQY